ncbi:fasciclin domain-containing protein [Parabacteroides pacaensis]|uniref:fasciclin domain-containing protein n=1 Tax=Parabacteroides pacaensis TaxID=2086575 RepID=UPI00131CFD50|nr:fasciclin domain-containing protein [Parabacteroides pacaensis]
MSKIISYVKIGLACMLLFTVFSCGEDRNGPLQLESDKMTIMSYLRDNPSYSVLVEALEMTDLSSALNLYGTITLFAPTDRAFRKYLSRHDLAEVSEMEKEELKELLYYHLFDQAYGSGFFISGSLPTATVEGNFIQMDISAGIKNTMLNTTVKVDSLDIPATNGVIHVINDVLEPPTQTIYAWLKDKPEYSILLEAFEKTGLAEEVLDKIDYETAGDGKQTVKWKTVFLETNEVLAKHGIRSFSDLAKKVTEPGVDNPDYTDPENPVNRFVRYHCLDKKYFLSDVTDDYIESFCNNQYLIFSTKQGISINEHGGTKVTMSINKCNNITVNGIVHSVDSLLTIYEPEAVTLIQRFAGEPADRNIVIDGVSQNLADVFGTLTSDPEAQKAVWWLKWEGTMDAVITSEWPANVFGDYCVVVNNNSSAYSLELATKPIFKGTYRVYVTYRRTNNTNYFVQFYWDDEKLGDLTDLASNIDAYGNKLTGTDTKIKRQVGILKIDEMAPHKFKLSLPNPAINYTAWYTLILEPVE